MKCMNEFIHGIIQGKDLRGLGGGLHFFFGQKMFSLTFKGPVLLNSMFFTPTNNSKYFFRNPCKRE